LRGALATKQSQEKIEIATPFRLAMTSFDGLQCNLFYASGNMFWKKYFIFEVELISVQKKK